MRGQLHFRGALAKCTTSLGPEVTQEKPNIADVS